LNSIPKKSNLPGRIPSWNTKQTSCWRSYHHEDSIITTTII
jgi:hypothetical protein